MRLTLVFVALALFFAAVLVVAEATGTSWYPWLFGNEENLGAGVLIVLVYFTIAALVGLLFGAAAVNGFWLMFNKGEARTLLHRVIATVAAVFSIVILGGLGVMMSRG